LLGGCGKGLVYLPWDLLRQRLQVFSAFYPFLGFLCIWAVPSYMPFILSMEEEILPLLPLFFVFVPLPVF
jgi:hypothetical protein